MSLSGAVDVAVGLVFTYFVFSSVCSGLNEGFARVVNSRGTQLFKSINALIGDVELATAFWEHELIAGLSRSRSKVGAQQASRTTLTAGIQEWGSANQPQGGGEWGLTILGWLLTIGALTFGAPFWFDLLTRMNSLRATGPPAKS